MDEYDVCIIGGGIVGMASAMAMLESRRCSLAVIEAEEALALHQSGRNSGVIHSGLYYRPGSLKARLCVEGRAAMERFCTENEVPYERCGKVVIATTPEEVQRLDELERRARGNGLEGVRRISGEELAEREPHVAAAEAALLVPETGIVDFAEVTRAMARVVRERGGSVLIGRRVRRVAVRDDGFRLDAGGEVRCRFLINCAGLHSDRVARLCGVRPDCRIVPFRGEYYELVPARRGLVRHLIYPTPDPRFPFLGVHLTRMIQGGVEAGPNAVLALSRSGYARGSVRLRDAMETLAYPGFWRLALRQWRYGLGEIARSTSRRLAAAALRRLVPEIDVSDLTPGRSGLRAQALDASGRLIDDFRIVEARRMLHVLNAPSPAATASISIGRHLAAIATASFDLNQAA